MQIWGATGDERFAQQGKLIYKRFVTEAEEWSRPTDDNESDMEADIEVWPMS